jgi:uncharacterized protein YfaS (alpha-2-macroglobulin family)
LEWLKASAKPEHAEFRDDRFVAAFNFNGGNVRSGEGDDTVEGDNEATDEAAHDAEAPPAAQGGKAPATTASVAYIVRAVTPGTYVHPAATVEDMYRPDRHARTASGHLRVVAKE